VLSFLAHLVCVGCHR